MIYAVVDCILNANTATFRMFSRADDGRVVIFQICGVTTAFLNNKVEDLSKKKFVWLVALQWHQTSPPEFYLPVCDPSFICISEKCLFERGEIKGRRVPSRNSCNSCRVQRSVFKDFYFPFIDAFANCQI